MKESNTPLSPNFIRPRRKIPTYLWCFFLLAGLTTSALIIKEKIGVAASPNVQAALGQKIPQLLPDKSRPFWQQIKSYVFDEKKLQGEEADRINFLLLGIGGKGHNGPDLTDSIMLMSVKPSSGQLAIISVPRDLSVPIPGFDWRKINSANAYGEARAQGEGAKFSAQIIGGVFDLPIHYYIRLDFEAFKQVVNELGGVEIEVERGFIDRAYPTVNNQATALTFKSGWQIMDGERALQYARSRHGDNGEGNDFMRSRRQQKLLLALKEKILSLSVLANPNRLLSIALIIDEHLQTNLGLWEIQQLFKLARKINYDQVISYLLDDGPNGLLKLSMVNGASILEPRGDSFAPLQELAKNIFNKSPSSPAAATKTVQRPLIEIQNGTWQLGLAARIKNDLETAGWSVAHLTAAASRTVEQTIIYDLSHGAYRETVVKLQDQLKAVATTAPPPPPLTPETKADILIIVGKDRSS